jgi:phosphoserine/homoserine phosphotransferase
MNVVCLDLEGVLVPEIWISLAEATGIDDLRLTTRDISDYDKLMQHRLEILDRHQIHLSQIQTVIAALHPLPGAEQFLRSLRCRYQVIILSDTFYQFADPLMVQLQRPTLFCHDLVVADDRIIGYRLRQPDAKRHAVAALQELNFRVLAAGDSYNDVPMLQQAHLGVLFDPPQRVAEEYPELPVAQGFGQLMALFDGA